MNIIQIIIHGTNYAVNHQNDNNQNDNNQRTVRVLKLITLNTIYKYEHKLLYKRKPYNQQSDTKTMHDSISVFHTK